MARFAFLGRWCLYFCLAVTLESVTFAESPPPAGRPNILFISIDDLNDWVACLGGHSQVKTPQMDRLARRGTLFTNAHCQAPLCNPSRTSVLTGLRPSTTGVYALAPWFRSDTKWKDHVTLPQHFAAHGYSTVTTGKIFHDAYPPEADRKSGAEFAEWGYHGRFGPRPEKKFVETPDRNPLVDWGVFPERDEDQDDWKIAEFAIEKLKSSPREPFLLAVGFRHPHVPCYASQRWFDLYRNDESLLPAIQVNDREDTPEFSWYLHWKLPEPRLSWLQESRQWLPHVRAYLASISFVDHLVGRVCDALDESGLADRTIIVLWSDHGYHLGEKEISGKNSLWERSTRVPLIFAGPGITPGARCGQPVELLDIYPTLAELCGLAPPRGVEGESLVPLLKDASTKRTRPAITTHNRNNHAVRSERWRYIRYADGSEELYDLQNDPHEWTNLASKAGLEHVRQEHARWLPTVNAPPLPGSRHRLLLYENGIPIWEGEAIGGE